MEGVTSVLQVVAVAVGSTLVLALLVSHLRYRTWILRFRDASRETLSAEGAVWLTLDHMRSSRPVLLGLFPADTEDVDRLRDVLPARLRAEDQVWKVEDRAVWLLLDAPPEDLPAVADRLRNGEAEGGIGAAGCMRLVAPGWDADGLLDTFRAASPEMPEAGWRVEPAEWPYAPEEPETDSPLADPLTGALAADRAPRAFRARLATHKHKSRPLALLRLDVDRLREYNQGPGGREVGDRVLKEVARVCMDACRETDPVARLEEDEFIIWMPVPAAEAEKAAWRISSRVRDRGLRMGEENYRFTVSVGIACFPDHGQTPRTLVECAVAAQSAAKRRGRGNVAVYEPTMRSGAGPKAASAPSDENF